jgi:Mlc titration factor MtfA (ptsG expression regulator)
MLAKIIAIPFMLCALTFLYFTWEVDSKYGIYIVPFVVALAVIYTLSPQINWWWYQRHPPDVKPGIRGFFERFFPYYMKLDESEKKRFRHRVAMFMEANNFIAKGLEEATEDMKAITAACAVQLSFGLKEYLLPKFENVVFSPVPFPSPQYPKNYHASEIYEEDGAVLFAVEQLMKGFVEPHLYYNIGLHEYAKAYLRSHPALQLPPLPDDIWPKLEQISGMSEAAIERWINLKPIPARPVSIAHFFIFPQQYQSVLPDLYQQYCELFNQSPVLGRFPVRALSSE